MRNLLTLAVLVLSLFSAAAQNTYDGKAVLLEHKGKQALFAVEVEVDKKGDIEACASEALMYILLTEGVPGINGGEKLMQKENKYWLSHTFFTGKNAPYKPHIAGAQLEDEPRQTPTGRYRGSVYINLNYDALLRQLVGYGVRNK